MARRNPIGPETSRVVVTNTEFDFAVAEHVGIGRATAAIFLEEVTEHALAIFAREAYLVQWDAQLFTNASGVLIVLGGRAVAGLVLVPIAHEQPLDCVALLLQQPGGDGRVDAAGHADDD